MVTVWTDALAAARTFADKGCLGPLHLDMRDAPRLSGAAAEVAVKLLAEFEKRSLVVAVVVGADLVQAARMHRLLSLGAPLYGRWFVNDDDGVAWVNQGLAAVSDAPVAPRPRPRSRPYLVSAPAVAARR